MGDRIGVTKSRKFNTSYVGSVAGALRILIIIVGVVAIVLSSVGSPHDTYSRNGSPGASQCDDFYGYGLGYIKEPLNVIFIICLSFAWIFAVAFVLFLGCESTHRLAIKLNRILYLSFGVILLSGTICGAIGTYYFWTGCCRVTYQPSSDRNQNFFMYFENIHDSYNDWCRCTVRVNDGEKIKTKEWFEFTAGHSSQFILSAVPHHFITHCLGLAIAAVDAVLCFIAVCVA